MVQKRTGAWDGDVNIMNWTTTMGSKCKTVCTGMDRRVVTNITIASNLELRLSTDWDSVGKRALLAKSQFAQLVHQIQMAGKQQNILWYHQIIS